MSSRGLARSRTSSLTPTGGPIQASRSTSWTSGTSRCRFAVAKAPRRRWQSSPARPRRATKPRPGPRCNGFFPRFDGADEYLLTVPRWNQACHGCSSTSSTRSANPAWCSIVIPRPAFTGLLAGKRAMVVYTSAVYYCGARLAFGTDFHRAYFNDWLRWAGIEHVSEVRLPTQPGDHRRRGWLRGRHGVRASAWH